MKNIWEKLKRLPLDMATAILCNGILGVFLLFGYFIAGGGCVYLLIIPAIYLLTAWLLFKGYRLGIYLSVITLLVLGSIYIIFDERVDEYIRFCRDLRQKR